MGTVREAATCDIRVSCPPLHSRGLGQLPPPQNPPTVAAVCHEMSPPTCSSIPKIWCWARLDLVLCELNLELSGVGFGVM